MSLDKTIPAAVFNIIEKDIDCLMELKKTIKEEKRLDGNVLTYYCIEDRVRQYFIDDEYGADGAVIAEDDDDYDYEVVIESMQDAYNYIKEKYSCDDIVYNKDNHTILITKWKTTTTLENLEDVIYFMQEQEHDDTVHLLYYKDIPTIVHGKLFLSRQSAEQYLQGHHYNYSEDAHVISMLAENNPELSAILRLIKGIDFEYLKEELNG